MLNLTYYFINGQHIQNKFKEFQSYYFTQNQSNKKVDKN